MTLYHGHEALLRGFEDVFAVEIIYSWRSRFCQCLETQTKNWPVQSHSDYLCDYLYTILASRVNYILVSHYHHRAEASQSSSRQMYALLNVSFASIPFFARLGVIMC